MTANQPIKLQVDCIFDTDGTVRVRRVQVEVYRWLAVEQGRQWADAEGRHVLIMLPEGVRELVLRADTLTWEMRELPGSRAVM